MQLRDLFAMRAHGGRWYYLLGKLRDKTGSARLTRMMARFEAATAQRSLAFDARHGVETHRRLDVRVSEAPRDDAVWGYGAVNEDYFREIIRAIPLPLSRYAFVDIGSGKGAAVLLASEFPFRRLIGLELTAELIEIARANVRKFNASTGANLAPEWVHCDFFAWQLPDEPLLFFFNDPFPEQISFEAMVALEAAVAASHQPALLVFRKVPKLAAAQLDRSALWKPLRLAPYWRVYAANGRG